MYWCTKGGEHALSRQKQEINKSIYHHTRLCSLYHKTQHQSFWNFEGVVVLYVEGNMLCDEKGYQARNHVSTVVGAFLAFVFIFLLLCLAYTCSPHTFFICWFTGIRGSKAEWFPDLIYKEGWAINCYPFNTLVHYVKINMNQRHIT